MRTLKVNSSLGQVTSSHVLSRWTRPTVTELTVSHCCYGQSRRARLVPVVHGGHVGVACSLGGPGTARSGSQDLLVSLGSTQIYH